MAQQRDRRDQFLLEANPIRPGDYMLADVMAWRAVVAGTANSEQQKRAVKFLAVDVCQINTNPWRKDPSQKDVCIGKQAVWQILDYYVSQAPLSTGKYELDAKIAARQSFAEEAALTPKEDEK